MDGHAFVRGEGEPGSITDHPEHEAPPVESAMVASKDGARRIIRAPARWIYRKVGLHKRVAAGLLVPDLSVCVPNFLFQRIMGINRGCKWPVHFTSRVMAPERIQLGERSALSFAVSGGCYIQAFNGIIIGDDVIFAPGVKMISANHAEHDRTGHESAPPIVLGRRCWIGANAVILPGVSLGENVIVGAGAVVTKSFPDNSVICGNPARIIRHQS